MATRTKPKDIVDASQAMYGVLKKLLRWIWIPLFIFTILAVAVRSTDDLHREGSVAGQKPAEQRQRADCTPKHPCPLGVLADGSTERVAVQPGKSVCFDPSFYNDLDRLRFMTSYRGRPEVKYGCTKEQVLAQTCKGTVFDSFRFIPEAGVDVPQYWFVPEGTTRC